MNLAKISKFVVNLLLLLGSGLLTSMAFGQTVTDSVTLSVMGEITALPCNIVWPSSTINLGTWSAPILNQNGAKGSPAKKVTLHFRNCPAEATAALITFTGTPAPSSPDIFANKAQGEGVAQDVGLALYYADPVEKSIGNNDTVSVPVSVEDSSFDFYAHMVSLHGASTAGLFSSTITLNVSWQ